MARAKSELRPCGVVARPTAAGGDRALGIRTRPSEAQIGKFTRQLVRLSICRLSVAVGEPAFSNRVGPRRRPALAVVLASAFVLPDSSGRLVILMSAGVPIALSVGGLLASWVVDLFGWPAIFVTGGALPLAVVPLLALWLPESMALRARPRRHNLAGALFKMVAPSTLLWAINGLSCLVY
jgi:MFS family permease